MSTASAVHQIRLIQTLDEFDGLALAWEELRSQAIASSIFVSHDFICAWLRSYGTGWEPFVLLAEAHDSLVGALPLCVSRTRLGRRSVCFLGDGYADYSDALIRSDSPSAYDVLADALFEKLGDWDFAHLRYLCSESQLLRSLNPKRRADWLVRSEVTMPNPYIEVVGTWPGQVSKKLSWQLKYQRRKLEKAHGEVTVSWGTTPEEVSAGLEVLYRLHRLRWESMKGSISNFTIAAARQVHASMFTQLAEKHRTLLSTLSVADRPIAVAVNLIGEDTIYYCQTAFDPEFADYSPSSQLLAELVDYCDTHGVMVLDLLRGDESYKHRWTDRTRTLSEVWLSRPGRMNAAAAAWTLDLRSRMREAPVVGPAIVKGRWLARRLASLRSCSGDSSSCDDLDERQSNER